MRTKLIIGLAALILSVPLMAQTKNVSGKVVSQSDGHPLAGVAVTIDGNKSVYAITDLDGKYSIKADNGNVLVLQ